MIGLSLIGEQRIRRPEPTFEAAHSPTTITQIRLADHKALYKKPRPANWWDWHHDVCNCPTSDKP